MQITSLILTFSACVLLMAGCGDPFEQVVQPPDPGQAEYECRQLSEEMCGMSVRCGHLFQSQYRECTDAFDAELDCDLARDVSPDYPRCLDQLESSCFDLAEDEFPSTCRGVVLF